MTQIELNQIKDVLKKSNEIIEKLTNEVEEMRPDAEFGRLVKEDDTLFSFIKAADMLADKIGLGQKKLFAWLREEGVLIKTKSDWNIPKRDFIERGYFKTKIKMTAVGAMTVPFFTSKGLEWVVKLWSKKNEQSTKI